MNIIKEILERYGYDNAVDLYNDSVNAYELTENPIMTDPDFDQLKNYLIESQQIEFVAGVDGLEGEKKEHVYPMLSIHSVHKASLFNQEELGKYLEKKYRSQFSNSRYSVSWKLDGIALQAKYENGELVHVLTRGERTHGVDVTPNVIHAFPKKVDKSVKAIIGEAVLDKKIFAEKFGRYKNERNATGGLINSKGKYGDDVKEITFVAFKIISDDDIVLCAWDNQDLFLDNPEKFLVNGQVEVSFDDLYPTILNMEVDRPKLDFRTDGVVIRNNDADLYESHRGLYTAYTAFKYDALQAKTKILYIDFRLCNNGALFPRAILEPVDLDGSTVQHVSLFNYSNMIENGLFPDAEIMIVKSGDIIPHVELVLNPVYETEKFRQEYGIDQYTYDGVNLFSSADLSELKFVAGLSKFDFKNVGDALAKDLYNTGITEILELFNLEYFPNGLKNTKPANGMITQIIETFKNVSITKLVQSLRFHGIGETSSKRLGILFTDLKNKGLSGVDLFIQAKIKLLLDMNPNVYERTFIESEMYYKFADVVSNNFDRINFDGIVEVIPESAIKVVLTGSPKDHGFAKKADFLEFMKTKGIEAVEVKNLKDADYLITDDLGSTSSKMKQAEKLGVEIKEYSSFK